MSKIDLRELQLFELKILEEVDRICQKHQIKYFLAYGSCLGAVRHHGFIPWDDDIDIIMLPKDYLLFMEVCKSDLGDEYYFQSHFDDAKTYIFWNRIGVKKSTSINLEMADIHQPWGICIDIFPLFPVSEDPKEQKKRYQWLRRVDLLSLKHYHMHDIKETHGLEKMKKMVHLFLTDSLNCYLFRHYFLKSMEESKTTGLHLTSYIDLELNSFLDASWFSEQIYLDFENRQFHVLKIMMPT